LKFFQFNLIRSHEDQTYLRPGIDRLQHVAGRRVPELDGPVGRAATSCQSLGLPGAPADSFNSGQVSG